MVEPQISCALAPTHDSPEHIRVAEGLGYARAWLYDTPQQSPDVWLTLALAAQKTSRIGLGPGVLVPSLRHPMVNATQTRTLQYMAPGRLAVAFGTGFTGRMAMGSRPLTWNYVAEYVRTYRGLLQGKIVEWDGARMRMLPAHVDHQEPQDLPPILLAATGPRGAQHAQKLGVDGLLAFGQPPAEMTKYRWASVLTFGTVLDAGEDPRSNRVQVAAGPGLAINYHFGYAVTGAASLRAMPGGEEFIRVVEHTPIPDRHFAATGSGGRWMR
jgi:5,10-methylenetetrahydromethanopterin reductase